MFIGSSHQPGEKRREILESSNPSCKICHPLLFFCFHPDSAKIGRDPSPASLLLLTEFALLRCSFFFFFFQFSPIEFVPFLDFLSRCPPPPSRLCFFLPRIPPSRPLSVLALAMLAVPQIATAIALLPPTQPHSPKKTVIFGYFCFSVQTVQEKPHLLADNPRVW